MQESLLELSGQRVSFKKTISHLLSRLTKPLETYLSFFKV